MNILDQLEKRKKYEEMRQERRCSGGGAGVHTSPRLWRRQDVGAHGTCCGFEGFLRGSKNEDTDVFETKKVRSSSTLHGDQ